MPARTSLINLFCSNQDVENVCFFPNVSQEINSLLNDFCFNKQLFEVAFILHYNTNIGVKCQFLKSGRFARELGNCLFEKVVQGFFGFLCIAR